MSGLPPITPESAAALYAQAKEYGAESLLLLAGGDERNLAAVALRALVVLGDLLVQREAELEELHPLFEELSALVEKHIGAHVERPIEMPVLLSTIQWRGASADYWNNAEAINKALAEAFTTPVDPE